MSLDGIGLKCSDPEIVKKVFNHPDLEFTAYTGLKTGIVYDHIKDAKYGSLRFKIVEDDEHSVVYINGNLYEYFYKLPNIGVFYFYESLAAIYMLCDQFGLDPQKTEIVKLECGLNIATDIKPDYIIKNIITYKGRQKKNNYYNGKGYLSEFEFQEYKIRMYCKSCKHRLNEHILRIELGVEKSNYLKKHGIYTLSDLKEVEKLKSLGNQLLQHVDNFIYDDRSIDLNSLPAREQKLILEYRDSLVWEETMAKSNDNYRKKKQRHREVVKKHGKEDWQTFLTSKIKEGMEEQLILEKVETFPVLSL